MLVMPTSKGYGTIQRLLDGGIPRKLPRDVVAEVPLLSKCQGCGQK